MKKKWKQAIVILESALILFLFSGCWNYHELETYSIVSGMAIDKGENGYKYHVTFECMKMSGGGKSGQIEPLLIEEDGNSVFDAVRSTVRESDKKLYFNHCKILVLGSEVAQDGIKSAVDWVKRDAEPRITVDMLVSKSKTAEEILRVKPQSGQLLSYQVDNTLAESAGYYGSSAGVQLYQATDILNSPGISLVLPAVEVKPTNDGETVQVSGGAVFRGDRLIGWLDAEPAKFYALIQGKTKGGLLLTGPTPGSTQICLEVLDCETKMKPVVSGQSLTYEIKVRIRAALAEQDSEKDLVSQIGIGRVEQYADQTIRYGITSVVKDVQHRFDSDIFGFGSDLYQNQPKEWSRLGPRWDQIFETISVKPEAEVEIENTALNVTKDGT